MAKGLGIHLCAAAERTLALLFYRESTRLSKWLGRAWCAALWVGRGVVGGLVLNWRPLAFDVHDWTQEGPRYAFPAPAPLEGRSFLPLVTAERVSSFFIVVPMVVISVPGGVALERPLRARRLRPSWLALLLVVSGPVAHDLLQHARLWRLENMPLLFPVMPVDIRAQVLTVSDPSYLTGLSLGLLTTLLSLGILGVMAGRERRLPKGAS